jgi:hypothetical protein
MNRTSGSDRILQKFLVLAFTFAVPSLLWAQHKPSGGGGSKPAAPAKSAPAHSAPASHGAAPSHGASASHGATQSHTTTGSRPSTAGHTTNPSHGASTSHTTTPSRGNTTAGHTTTPSRGNTAAGHTTTAGHGATTSHAATPGNRGAAGGHTAAGGRPAGAASRGNVGSHTPPGRNVSLKGGGRANVRPNGSIRSVDRNGMHIEHGVRGGRTVVSERNGARIVTRGRLCAASLRHARRARLLLANFLCWRTLPRRPLSRLRLGRTHVLRLLPWSLVPSRILWVGLASMGSADCLGYRCVGLGRRAMVGILWRVVESLSGICCALLLADRLSDRVAIAGGI